MSAPEPKDPCAKAGAAVTCEQCVEFLLDYVDGILPGDVKFQFESHLAFCPDCTTYLDNYRKAAALTQGAGLEARALPADVPAGLIEAILKARGGERR